ncbi:nitrilase-related carbon-nitrogen hydrolase [Salinicola avicenniae]|uniref:nitrilase-related carbon-nitrogen hydrolase n=1 Tax=Salinicola avicenniae TaxID=2916836 RepID=UPI002074488E|nr:MULTISPECIES: nitrilase-related carbon-nitrogen hydrolase [unclassified Salinicola]
MDETRSALVGAAQMNCCLGDVDANLAIHHELIREGRERRLALLAFPELSLTGYDLGATVREVAMKPDDPRLLALARASGEMLSVVGFVESVAPGEYANAAACLRDGRVVAVHRKMNLCTYGGHEEGKLFRPGRQLTQAEAGGLACGVMICADLWNPGLAHAAMLRRPDLIVTPINSALGMVEGEFDDEANWLACLRFYAMVYGTPIVMAHRDGEEKGGRFWGGSCIVGVDGHPLARAAAGSGIVSAVIDRADIARARFAMPTHRDADTPLVASLLAAQLREDASPPRHD